MPSAPTRAARALIVHESLHVLAEVALRMHDGLTIPPAFHLWICGTGREGLAQDCMHPLNCATVVEAERLYAHQWSIPDVGYVSDTDRADAARAMDKETPHRIAQWFVAQFVHEKIRQPVSAWARAVLALDTVAIEHALRRVHRVMALREPSFAVLADPEFAIGDLPVPQIAGIPDAGWPRYIPDEIAQ